MRKAICMILCLVLLLGCARAQEEAAQFDALSGKEPGFVMLKELYASGENSVVSPLSLLHALGMAAEGAQGETLAEILNAMGVETLNEISSVLPEGIHSANAVFTAPELDLKEAYRSCLMEKYGAEFFALDGQTVETVNEWVRQHTNGLIDSLLQEAPDADTALMLLNALALEADWAKPFMAENTLEEIFRAPGEDVPVEMMHQTDMFAYAEKDGVQIICLPYANCDLEMWIALPAQEGAEGLNMHSLLEVLAEEGMHYLKSDADSIRVDLAMPKLDISDENSLVEGLQALGVELAFGKDADFSAIADEGLYIDQILQKTRVQTDESGTKAVAATLVVMFMMMAPGMELEPVEMHLDRPFIFAIADRSAGNMYFAGVVENPGR